MIIRMRLGQLRRFIRGMLKENPAGASLTADPTDVKGFYPYEIERGTDVHSFWYKSPGRSVGGDGDPGRPADAADYIGIKEKSSSEAGEEAEGGEKPIV